MSQRGPWAGTIAAIAGFVLCLAVAGAGIWRADDIAARLSGEPPLSWRPGAAESASAVLPAATGTAAPLPAPAQLAATLQPLFADPALGPNVTAHVLDVATGQVLVARNADSPTVPASTIKLVTAAAALVVLGPMHRLATRAVAGAAPGEVVLVGGGDPTLSGGATGTYPDAARLPDLAAQVKKALGGTVPTKVSYDPSIFTGPAFGPWDGDIPTNGVVSAITGLMTDGARPDPKVKNPRRLAQPDLTAAQQFATLLGVPRTAVVAGVAPADAQELGAVLSMRLGRLVEVMLVDSDNVIAESLARHIAIKRGKPASFEGGAAAEREVIGELGLPVEELIQADGSGLARANKVSPSLLAELIVLSAKADRGPLRAVLTGLPVSAYSGTLSLRFRKPTAGATAAGVVRAKTGTLRSVSSVAGVITTAEGRLLAFAVLADSVPVSGTFPAQDALDRIAAAIAACGCR